MIQTSELNLPGHFVSLVFFHANYYLKIKIFFLFYFGIFFSLASMEKSNEEYEEVTRFSLPLAWKGLKMPGLPIGYRYMLIQLISPEENR